MALFIESAHMSSSDINAPRRMGVASWPIVPPLLLSPTCPAPCPICRSLQKKFISKRLSHCALRSGQTPRPDLLWCLLSDPEFGARRSLEESNQSAATTANENHSSCPFFYNWWVAHLLLISPKFWDYPEPTAVLRSHVIASKHRSSTASMPRHLSSEPPPTRPCPVHSLSVEGGRGEDVLDDPPPMSTWQPRHCGRLGRGNRPGHVPGVPPGMG
jgi:hypothetical protein